MDINRFEVIHEKDIKQYSVFDNDQNKVVVRYSEKRRADKVCKDLNTNFK